MTLEQDKVVIYRNELCRIKSVEMYAPDGVNRREYCILAPLASERSTYYVPVEFAAEKLREPLTRDEVISLIDGIRGHGVEWCTDGVRRKAWQDKVLSEGDHADVIRMAGAVYDERERRKNSGKKLSASDERAMKAAEQMINNEFAYALGIEPEDVAEFIRQRLG